MDNIKTLISNCGWESAKSLLGAEYLVNRVCNNDPLVFLSFYYDPNPTDVPEYNNRVVFTCQATNKTVFFLYKKTNDVSTSNELIMKVLQMDFGLTNMNDIELVIKEWFNKMYNVNVRTVRRFYSLGDIVV